MLFFIIFVIIPLIEIVLFMRVGGEIGVVSTLFLCLLTAMIGAALLRQQGLKTLFSARKSMQNNALPIYELFDGLCLVIAGITLMTPGFFTDAIGFLLLVPFVRLWLRHALKHRFDVYMQAQDVSDKSQDDFIEVDYKHVDENEDS